MVPALHVGAGDAALALALKIIRRRARLGWVAFGGNSPRPRDGGQRRASAVAEEPAVAAACVIYVTDDGEPEMVRKLGDGGEELRKVATAGYYVGGLGTLFPLSDRAGPHRCDLDGLSTAGIPPGMLGPAGVGDVIEHRRLPTAKPAR